jgi:TetR/AcrR family transcriptional regulator, lmrAB and yxaGH operons repressor
MGKIRDSRKKAVEGAERLFRTQGYAATGLTQILEVSGTPKGSFYFHFPGGKRQLAQEVLEVYGQRVLAGMQALAAKHSDPAGFVRALGRAMAKEMEATGWTLGCAAQNLAIELAPADCEFTDALERTFAKWTSAVADGIKAAYSSRHVAERRAAAILAAFEGAKTLARASRSADPFDAVIEIALRDLQMSKTK